MISTLLHSSTILPSSLLYSFPCSSFFFFFQSSAAHPDLHSFPTRRSSDLSSTATCGQACRGGRDRQHDRHPPRPAQDRKSTRLNSSHMSISYAVFCLKKKKKKKKNARMREPSAESGSA